VGGRSPRRLSEVIAIAKRYGCELDGGGKHNFKLKKAGCRTYTIPAHNGQRSEVPWKYIAGLCRCMQIPEEAFTES
jgi:hypothetical protein